MRSFPAHILERTSSVASRQLPRARGSQRSKNASPHCTGRGVRVCFSDQVSPKLTASAASTAFMVGSSTRPMRSRRRDLSRVRICSSRMMLSRLSPALPSARAMCVGSLALSRRLVIAAAMTVGLWRLPVGVVLHDQHRAHAALLAADHRAEIGVIDLSAFDDTHAVHSGEKDSSPALSYVPDKAYCPRKKAKIYAAARLGPRSPDAQGGRAKRGGGEPPFFV